ncbi:MAG: hypothetical protein O2794_02335 [bacterium]|nr:hypothetical protein [bacterium]
MEGIPNFEAQEEEKEPINWQERFDEQLGEEQKRVTDIESRIDDMQKPDSEASQSDKNYYNRTKRELEAEKKEVQKEVDEWKEWAKHIADCRTELEGVSTLEEVDSIVRKYSVDVGKNGKDDLGEFMFSLDEEGYRKGSGGTLTDGLLDKIHSDGELERNDPVLMRVVNGLKLKSR